MTTTHRERKIDTRAKKIQFAEFLPEGTLQEVNFVIKLLSANGGCLGAKRRRRT